MAEDDKQDKPISKRLKFLFIIPLILSVVICSAIVIVVVFITQQNWVAKTQKTLKEKQLLFMENYALTVKHTLESTLNMQYLHLNIISQMYIKQENGEISASTSLQQPIFKSAYDSMQDQYPNTSSAEWVSGKTESKGPDSDEYQIPDALFRTYFNSTKIFKQAGYLTNYDDDDMFYLYPVEDMDFLSQTFNYSATCAVNQSHYRPECTDAYAYMFGQKMFILVYYENSKLYMMQDFSDGDIARASVMSLPLNTLTSKLMTGIGYTTFACNIYGKWTLAVSGSEIEEFVGPNREISYALYQDNSKAREDFIGEVLGTFTQSKGAVIKKIDSVNTFIAFVQLNLSVNSQDELNYTVGVTKIEKEVLQTWNDFNDDILILMIIQACIYAGFLLVTIAIAWRLSLVIEHRVAKPIESISGYMKCGDPTLYMIQDSYNCQLNSILDNLRKIEDIEKLIDPIFLLNPITQVRIKNLEVARTLFQSIDNKRGLAIVLNLLGNLNFSAKKLHEAEGFYVEALAVLEQLYEEIIVQENREIEREEQEKGLFYKKKLSEVKVLDSNQGEKNKDDRVEIVVRVDEDDQDDQDDRDDRDQRADEDEEMDRYEKFTQEEEKKQLLQSLKTISDFWIIKKRLILDLISEQILQICLALKTRLKDEPSSLFASSRAKWKELITLKTRVLQHYINYKQSLPDYLDLLLDIAEDFQILKFSHTCAGILELVEFNILTLKNDEKAKINVDSGRLRKFGISILDSGFNQHFCTNPELFELDYLTQKLYYTSGKLYLDKEMYYKAALMFQSAIVFCI